MSFVPTKVFISQKVLQTFLAVESKKTGTFNFADLDIQFNNTKNNKKH